MNLIIINNHHYRLRSVKHCRWSSINTSIPHPMLLVVLLLHRKCLFGGCKQKNTALTRSANRIMFCLIFKCPHTLNPSLSSIVHRTHRTQAHVQCLVLGCALHGRPYHNFAINIDPATIPADKQRHYIGCPLLKNSNRRIVHLPYFIPYLINNDEVTITPFLPLTLEIISD